MKKKTMLAGLLSACVVGSVSVLSLTGSAADKVYGDANLDGSVDMSDCVLIMQSLANPSKFGTTGTNERHLTVDGADLADVSERGNGITANDALSIQRYLLGTIKSLPESFADGQGGDSTSQDEVNTKIHLGDNAITVEGQYASADGSKVTISHSGSFTIDGTLSDGQIYVDIPDIQADNGTVKLIFSGVNITGKSAPALFINNADKTSVTIADGTENTVSDGTDAYTGDNEGNAVIEAKDDLTIKGGDKGTGVLTITANTQTAVVCNNDIKFTGGITNIETLNTELANDAVKGKSSVTVKGGKLSIRSEGDGIKSTKGNVDLSDGEVVIKCGNDAVQAETAINISGGDISAFGDRGLTSAGTISITGGELIATATDCQCENLTSTEQNTIMFDFVKEWGKNNPIALTDASNKELFDKNTAKKFRYAVISSAEIGSDEYKLFTGGIKMKHSAGSTFKAGKPASYKEVNNDMENEEQLYSGLFSQDMIHKINVKMDEAQWDNLIANASKEEWTPCDIVIDGEELKNVGIRTKGNSSLMMAKNGKYSFRIKTDKFDKDVNYHGLTELCMNNMLMDASCLRDILCYNAMYEIDGVAPHAAHTDMYLNGELYSFYLLAEQPGTTVAERYAVDDDSVLYKATESNGAEGGWGGFGGDSYCSFTENMPLDRFAVKFGTDDEFKHIQDIKTAINKLTPTDYKFIEDVIDVPSFLKGFAVNSIFCNYDSYNGSLAHNYYLMFSGGKAYFVGWDYNLCLGNFTGGASSVTSDITTSLYQSTIEDRPLAKLLQVPEYYDMYVDIVNQVMDYYSDPESYVSEYAKKIRSHVIADPRASFTADEFDVNTSKSAEGLQYSEEDTGMNWGNWNMDGNAEGGAWQGFGNGENGDAWQGFGNGENGGAWQGFGNGDASFDWANVDWENMDWGEMGFGDMDFGNMDWGNGMFGGGQTSVVDFLIKRFEIIREALKK
ncbi:carbohydrate-binding domain-containing protein [Ruminococcus sp.]|uniref:carbohydrate-binding domain-containing protein n=1 Tax=Ruminococcus sp. TaxID=41978 RepID=UPI0025D42D45|nr:carbohydrate-binding domain-containing protein [Ruminococcus sp.]MCR4639273.1 carbohydrate-binding domain-containing protein [Ruminococcus sp.]